MPLQRPIRFMCLLTAVGSAAACGAPAPGDPEVVVERFIAAANSGQRVEAYNMLGPNSRRRLGELRHSAKRVSGRLALQPEDFLAVGRAPAGWEAAGVRRLRQTESEALVQVYSAAGDRHNVALVKEGKRWKIELPGG